MGHGKPGKSWNATISFSRPGKPWSLSLGHRKSWELTKMIFPRTTQQEVPQTHDRFHIMEKRKTSKSPGKCYRKSWNFIRSKECEP